MVKLHLLFLFPSLLLLLPSYVYYLCAIQGFSERLVTASRPAIGLMFKQVCMFFCLEIYGTRLPVVWLTIYFCRHTKHVFCF